MSGPSSDASLDLVDEGIRARGERIGRGELRGAIPSATVCLAMIRRCAGPAGTTWRISGAPPPRRNLFSVSTQSSVCRTLIANVTVLGSHVVVSFVDRCYRTMSWRFPTGERASQRAARPRASRPPAVAHVLCAEPKGEESIVIGPKRLKKGDVRGVRDIEYEPRRLAIALRAVLKAAGLFRRLRPRSRGERI